ncbi:LssY C-terminal domain-containing protein [Rhodopirellula sp. P2]|uniref:LssY C-terminal domain-containing protein n=1 Tax=Rhodopirellula sp. P2 TaxID=2127060 RepID=UPI0023677481|nr:LssY C-terminal domain-containing protein [Rhodopirellula sp. P2]WDQ19350.1 LssY C-terminal domain-containing protein [Rhodopirellula sp. P2]
MNEESALSQSSLSRRRRVIHLLIGLGLIWGILAYLVAPLVWQSIARVDPALDDVPRITETGDHHPGDPLNVALIGTEFELESIMHAAGWYAASALGLKSDLEIAADTVLSRPDDAAPVSSLYLDGRKEDFAFEQPVGDNPRHRHHVRFWKSNELSDDGRPQWIGSAVYDERVGLSRTTGQITHVTAADVDTERDYLFECLEKTGQLRSKFIVRGFHLRRSGRNGGGDPWQTDGDLYRGVIRATMEPVAPAQD